MIKKWNQFIREFVENSNSVVDAKMQELSDLINSISDNDPNQNLIYEWENKNDHELIINFNDDNVSIRYEFDIDDLYLTKIICLEHKLKDQLVLKTVQSLVHLALYSVMLKLKKTNKYACFYRS